MQYVQLRKGKFQYYRRVPTEVAHLDRRPFVKISLKTDSEAIARKRVVHLYPLMPAKFEMMIEAPTQ